MMMRYSQILTICMALLLPFSGPSHSAEPYDKELHRLSEILGSLHYLRNLCGETGSDWRDHMQSLLVAEAPDDTRKALMIAQFNAGYRSFSEIYVQCTPTALSLIDDYVKEGASLSAGLVQKFGGQ